MAGLPLPVLMRAGRDHWRGEKLPPFPTTGLEVVLDWEIMQTRQGWMYEALVVTPGRTPLLPTERVAVKVWRHDAMADHFALSGYEGHISLGPDACPLDKRARCEEDAEREIALLRAHAHSNIIALYDDADDIRPPVVAEHGVSLPRFRVAVLEYCAGKDLLTLADEIAKNPEAEQAHRAHRTLQQLLTVRACAFMHACALDAHTPRWLVLCARARGGGEGVLRVR
jgi:hypothetical protein